MDAKKCCIVQLLQLLVFILDWDSCHGLNITGEKGRGELSSSPSVTGGRKGKQFYVPVLFYSYPYPLRLLVANANGYSVNNYNSNQNNQYNHLQHFLPLYYQPQSYHYQTLPETSTSSLVDYRKFLDEFKELHYNKVTQNDASQIHKKTANAFSTPCSMRGKAGLCKPFSDCFPMMEMESDSNDYMNSPLAEQLALNTNVSTCSERDQKFVCCPNAAQVRKSGYISPGSRNEIGQYYSDYAVNLPAITQRPPSRQILSRQLIEKKMCGQSKLLRPPSRFSRALVHKGELKITGGVEALGPEEFPWMVGVFGKNKKLFCGASLITEQFLLSAAHCFSTFSPSDIPHLYVHLGDFNIRTTADGPHTIRRIEKLIIHKNFKIENYHNDIALLKLDRPVNFTDRIHPICLPEATMNSLENRKLVVAGWGRKYRYGTLSNVLRKVEMPIWDHNECKRVYSTFAPGRLLDSNLCAGDGKRNKDACIGDSGGGAVQWDGEKWVVQGIISWGKGCGSFPGVYTRVDKHLMWLTSNINKYSSSKS